jgi:hypothetical protein
MLDGKSLSAAIRAKKKNLLKPDMDSAGQEGLDPTTVDEIKQNMRVSETLGQPDHAPASPSEMGEDESSQDESKRKKVSARIASYFKGL